MSVRNLFLVGLRYESHTHDLRSPEIFSPSPPSLPRIQWLQSTRRHLTNGQDIRTWKVCLCRGKTRSGQTEGMSAYWLDDLGSYYGLGFHRFDYPTRQTRELLSKIRSNKFQIGTRWITAQIKQATNHDSGTQGMLGTYGARCHCSLIERLDS